jgi:hypothetical protein
MSPRAARRVLACALIVLGLVPSAWPQTTEIDPGTLIGRWSGSWVGAHQARRNGQYYLTIERIAGNRLTFSKIELTIDGDSMRGAGPDYTITLTKEK